MSSDLPDDVVHDALAALCGAVASIERNDHVAVDSLIDFLHQSFDHVSDVLVIISLVSLDRLDAAVGVDQWGRRRSTIDPSLVLNDAVRAGRADRCTVDAAAWRLDAIRMGDLAAVGADVAASQSVATDVELIRGAIALLATIVSLGAQRDDVSPRQAAGDLCLAAAMSAAST